MKLFALYQRSPGGLWPKIRTGGTYFKFFPARQIIKVLKDGEAEGFTPFIYLHPYEFLTDAKFWAGPRDLAGAPLTKNIYFQARQLQWHVAGNWTVRRKLEKIFEAFEVGGKMSSLL